MRTYTFSEARQKLSSLLEQARNQGEVMIRRKDGSLFIIKPISPKNSPLDVPGVDAGMNAEEIVEILREVRRR